MLKSKTALVTGSTSGIGLGIARKLAANGASIILNGFAEAGQAESIQKELQDQYKVRATYANKDLSKVSEIETLARECLNEFGTIDILVNNAGVQYTAAIESFPPEKWELIIALNLSAAFHLTRLLLPAMKAKGWGRIINIASVHGLVASTEKSAYVAAKHGLVGLTKVIALECAESNITCNAVCPGWVLTALVQKQIDAIALERGLSSEQASEYLLSEKQPSKRFTQIDQVADLCLFLSSPLQDNLTGTSIPIDGAWTAR